MSAIATENLPHNIVPAIGPENAEIMIVGEAPGETEARMKQPFVGVSGKLLDRLLVKAGILRQVCYITNVIKERPPNNNLNVFIRLGNKVVISKAARQYIDLLKTEIETVRPNVIIAVGNAALYALTGEQGITKWRGSVMESSLVPGVKVIPIIHPAAALRQYSWRHLIAFDLRRAKQQSMSPDLPVDDRRYILKPTFEECIDYLSACWNAQRVAFDIEVSKGFVTCISFAYSDKDVISIPFINDGREYFTIEQEREVWKRIADILGNERIEKIAQNAMFDTSFLLREYAVLTNNVQDTMIAQAILYPDFSKGLAFITSLYTDIPYYKDEGKSVIKDQIKGFTSVGADWQMRFWRYNALDSIVLMEAFPKQVAELKTQGNYKTYKRQASLLAPLLFMTERGIRMDVDGLKKQASAAKLHLAELEKQINITAGYELNPRSPTQLKDYFYTKKKYPPYKDQGKVTTNEKALKRLSGKGDKVAQLVLEHRTLAKLEGTYFSMKLDDDGRLRSSINPVGARTGRLSSSKTIFGTGANIQNQPPIMKKFMLPDEGYVAYNLDLSQAENRVVAYLGPDVSMIDAFENGVDIHSKTASLIFGIPVEEIIDMNNNDVKSDLGGGRFTHRYWGKRANHGLNYGLGYKSFALHLEISERDAKWIHDQYHRAYPGVAKYHRAVQEELRQGMVVTNLFGRKYTFTDRWGDTLFKEAYAFIPQSTVADIINERGLAYVYNDPAMKSVELLAQVHDSIAFQIPLSVPWLDQAFLLDLIKSSLETPLEWKGRRFVIPVDFSIHAKNLKDGVEFKHTITHGRRQAVAQMLESAYHQLTTGD